MAESILCSSVEKIVDTLTSLAGQEICLAWGLESDLRMLKTTLSSIKAVILDAEEQQAANHQITSWLSQLRSALYDAEDVLDDLEYHLLRKEVIKKAYGGVNKKVRRFSSSFPMSYSFRIGHRIKVLRLRLEDIGAGKTRFNLVDRPDIGPVQLREREMNGSLFTSPDIIGRDEDRDALVEFLTDSRQDHASYNNVEVIPIVGISGLGKTALAKRVFYNPTVVDHFHSRLWVCLSDMKEFDVNQVMSKIGRDNLQQKTFLLVLDDVWDVNLDKWSRFISLLPNGCKGSKILVTTRIDSVARCVGTVTNPYNLEGLPQEECVSLFEKVAFASEDEVDEELMKIGEDIVKKCKGVPLAIRSLGSLLFKESDVNKWLAVRDSNIWQIAECQKSILPILKFSYHHLPSQLKQCFVYCSLFPEDYLFGSQSLITFWMAHGLLRSPNENQKPEDVGKQYVKELLSRGFFQDYQRDGLVLDWLFKMHDSVRDLACSLGQGEFFIVNDSNKEIKENVRHVFFHRQDCSRNSSNAIRTAFANSSHVLTKSCIYQFKCLRFLCLVYSDVTELPHNIGTLKHLRSLDLSLCSNLERLPDSICKLHHLQSLNLNGCSSLEELPEKIGELISLRYLWITTQQKHLPRNNRIECLPSLQVLGFSECDQLENLFERTETLTNFTLAALEVLHIRNCRNLNLYFKNGEGVDVSQCLHLPGLRSLTIIDVDLTEGLPEWIRGCSQTLQFLEMSSCGNLKELPEWLPNLSSLNTLNIEYMDNLNSLPQGMERLTALKTLMINGNPVLLERCKRQGGEDWPKIAHVPNILIGRF